MPAGISWGNYVKFTISALLSSFAGSQIVHLYYRPLDDLDKYVQEELQKRNKPDQNENKIEKFLEN